MKSYKLRYLPLFYDDVEKVTSYITDTLRNPIAAKHLILKGLLLFDR